MARIAQINTVATSSNSVGGIMRDIDARLKAYGHECVICAGRGDMTDVDIRIGSTYSIYIHALLSRVGDSEGLHSRHVTERLVDELRKFDPDVVIVHNVHGHYLNVPYLFKALSEMSVHVVLALHDCWWLTGHCASYAHRGCRPGMECAQCRYYRAEYPVSWLNKGGRNLEMKRQAISLISPDRLSIVVPTRWMGERVDESWMQGRDLTLISNGVDVVEPITPLPSERSGVLAVASRWTPNKGLDDVLALASHPSRNFPITVVGDLMGARLPLNVKHIPYTSAHELSGLYRGAKALFNPTRADAFGLVTAESMAYGTPVIGWRDTVTEELVAGGGGVVVPQGDIDAVIKALDALSDLDPTEVYRSRYSRQAMVDAYASLINRL